MPNLNRTPVTFDAEIYTANIDSKSIFHVYSYRLLTTEIINIYDPNDLSIFILRKGMKEILFFIIYRFSFG